VQIFIEPPAGAALRDRITGSREREEDKRQGTHEETFTPSRSPVP